MDQIALCTADDIKGITHVTASNYSHDDPMIKTAILLASTIIMRYLGRAAKEGPVTDTFTVPRGFRGPFQLYPTGGPIKDGSLSVTVNGQTRNDALTAAGDKFIYNASPELENTIVTMTYTGGWPVREQTTWEGVTVLDAPQDIVQACALQASFMANRFLKDTTGEKSTGIKAGSMMIIPEAAYLLGAYRRQPYMGA